MKQEPFILTLDNGIRLVHRQVKNTEVIHCGVMLDTGSRDENLLNNGVAHFIEHTVFKGTQKRKSHHILRRIENVGGELNAFTTREKTCYYASCLKKYADRAVDLLTDITFNSVFPEKEIEKEKKVILEEIDMYDDNPEESVYDDFYARLFNGHPLGFNILGTKETVSGLTRDSIRDFIKLNYVGDKLVLSIVGNISNTRAENLARAYLEKIELPKVRPENRAKPEFSNFRETLNKDFAQAHCIIGAPAYSRQSNKKFGLSLINNILGNAGMSSRLNMAVREKYGLTYHISSHYSTYQDAGVFTIYFATDAGNLLRCQDLIGKELKKLREQKFSDKQLRQAKLQLMGQMAMIVENNSGQMQHQARSLLDYNKVFSFKDYMNEIESITPDDIQNIANEILDADKLRVLIYEDLEK